MQDPDGAGASLIADDEGVTQLFQREHGAMVRLAVLLVGSRAVAEEVVQDAFVAVGQRWDSVTNPGGYLRASVVNGCRTVLRRRDLERERYAELSRQAERLELPPALVELADALDALTERQRVVIVLRYLLDLADAEIARILDCRRATVRSLAKRALDALREELT